MSRARRLALPVLASFAFALLAGCDENPADPEPEPVIPPRGTPQGLLGLFAYTSEGSARDIELVGECLHEDFRFYFTEEDRMGDPSLPELWTREEFLGAVGNMFEGAIAISMDLTVSDSLAPAPCTEEPVAPTCTTYEILLDFAVLVSEEPENRTFLVHGFADMTVVEEEPGSGLFVLYRVQDRTSVVSRGMAVEPTSWGHVLALYRADPVF